MRGPKPTPIQTRILRRIVVTETGCWEWQGYRLKNGYGVITANKQGGEIARFGGRTVLIHRVMWEIFVGPLGDLHIDHTCMNPPCCNTAHLEAVTQAENNRRTRERGNHWSPFTIQEETLVDA